MLELSGSDDAEALADNGEAPRVYGFAGTPQLHRANRNYLTFFANRRWIQDRSLAHAVAEAYHTLLPVGRHPVA